MTSILAHILSGGEMISLHSTIFISISSLAISALLARKVEDPFNAVFAIFASQNLGHFILGGDSTNNFTMFFAHVFSGVVSRIRMKLDTWNKVSTASKSTVIGRSLDDGALLDSSSATSHQGRAFTKNGAGIIRRGFNYDDNYLADGTRDAGLIFISFQAELKNYLDIQAKLNAVDSLNKYTTPVGSALFIIPPGATPDSYLGAGFFN